MKTPVRFKYYAGQITVDKLGRATFTVIMTLHAASTFDALAQAKAKGIPHPVISDTPPLERKQA
jgi:hypothetical protein